MSGVSTGTRLERLYRLRRCLDLEIAAELRRNPPQRLTPRRRAEVATKHRLDELGVTPRQVKEWAVEIGLLPAVRQGRVARHLIEAYAEAKGLR